MTIPIIIVTSTITMTMTMNVVTTITAATTVTVYVAKSQHKQPQKRSKSGHFLSNTFPGSKTSGGEKIKSCSGLFDDQYWYFDVILGTLLTRNL